MKKIEEKDYEIINGSFGVSFVKFKILQKYEKKLTHAITLRNGGVSKKPYDSLNFRKTVKGEIENVSTNLKICCDELKVNFESVCKATQTHSNNILILNDKNKDEYLFSKDNKEEFDAYIVEEKNITTYITTADCIPIIIYDPIKNIVSNIHSGWRGTVAKIYMNVINVLKSEYDSNINDLIICIGPHIRSCCFSSEELEFKEKFTNVWKNELEYIFYENNKKRFHIDMEKLIIGDILKAGIRKENIATCNICTCCNSDKFFSCRASKKYGSDFGTFATFVCLK